MNLDPSNQTTGLIKWLATVVAGYIAGHFGLSNEAAATISALALGVLTLLAQIYHRVKVGKAQAALANAPPTINPVTISNIAKEA